MQYLSAAEAAKKWKISERSVRNYCAKGRVEGAVLKGKTWKIPADAEKPQRINTKTAKPQTLLEILQHEKAARYSGGIYHKTQIEMTYNSNHIEGSRLTHDQTRYIFETNTIGITGEAVNVDDVIETANHFRCIDLIIDKAKAVLTEKFIKELPQKPLATGIEDMRLSLAGTQDKTSVIVVAGGAKDYKVKLEILKACEALLNLPTANIEILVGK